METPKIYVACLASYNNGILYGKWIDVVQSASIYEEIHKMLAESPIETAEEFAIHDYEGFGCLSLGEYESIESVAEFASFIGEHGELGAELLSEYSIEEAERLLEESYYGAYDNEIDFAYTIFEDCYHNAIPENLLIYFDYVSFTRDLFINDYFSVDLDGQTHIFSNY
ncbi:MAG: antirestriction protein ArdA [Tatlockia sp.]|nr:antirestriction protein ArdA [Tatlockia sp.]